MSENTQVPKNASCAPALCISDLSKTYRLHSSQLDQLIEVLNLQRFGINPKSPAKEFSALNGINLRVSKGERLGIVGRNGAGKSTLLKLICGNIKPSSGSIEVNGTVQALLTAGNGFNPEFTGLENIKASLQYNELPRAEYEAAIEDIKDFCELGPFFEQPFKTYSAGMQARLMFAAATAIKPNILIVDEVLGAGDAYFIAKSKQRVAHLVTGGCTMLLVSHAMSQILELCQRTIWINEGKVVMEGDSFEVVKAYEAFLHGTIQHSGINIPANSSEDGVKSDEQLIVPKISESTLDDWENVPKVTDEKCSDLVDDLANAPKGVGADGEQIVKFSSNPDIRPPINIQDPPFWPGANKTFWPKVQLPIGFNFIARGGITPWDAKRDVAITGFTIFNETGQTNQLITRRPMKFTMEITAKKTGDYALRYAIVVFDYSGRSKINLCSGTPDICHLAEGEARIAEVELSPLLLGENEYIVSLSVHHFSPLEVINSATCYDLLSRSFCFQVKVPETLRAVASEFNHPAQWHLHNQEDA